MSSITARLFFSTRSGEGVPPKQCAPCPREASVYPGKLCVTTLHLYTPRIINHHDNLEVVAARDPSYAFTLYLTACRTPMELNDEPDAVDRATQPIHYAPLETPETIRLINARRLTTNGNIDIKLKHFPLNRAHFRAISYVWGEKKLHPQKVVINGGTCQVLESIYPILALICDDPGFNKGEWFWIDYLCINQDDSLERAAQVALMGALYQKAHRTLVWLGEGTSDVRGASELLKSLAGDLPDSENVGSQLDYDGISPEKWRALRHWMGRPW